MTDELESVVLAKLAALPAAMPAALPIETVSRDYSDIPPLGKSFMKKAAITWPQKKVVRES